MARFACCALTALVAAGLSLAAQEPDRAAAQAELARIAPAIQQVSRAFNLIHTIVRPSVVDLHVRTNVATRITPFTRKWLEVPVGEGSGFVFASNETSSWVITNAHVAVKQDDSGAYLTDRQGIAVPFEGIQVETWDNRLTDAVFLGADLDSDLAVLRLAIPNLPTLDWADSDQAQVGDWVLAAGFPMAVGYSVSSGIISAVARSTDKNSHNFESYLQTDAAINPGNSGGPLVNLNGQVVGVNARIVSRTAQSAGLGFAIPSNLARRVADDLKNYGRVFRPFFGVQMDEVPTADSERLGLPNPQGVALLLVMPGTPAATAGLKSGDIVLALGGIEVQGLAHLRTLMAASRIGEASIVRIWRQGAVMDIPVTPLSQEEVEQNIRNLAVSHQAREELLADWGLVLSEDGLQGLIVREVQANSPAAEAGLRSGDRIYAVKGYGALSSVDEFISLAMANPQMIASMYRDGRAAHVLLRRKKP